MTRRRAGLGFALSVLLGTVTLALAPGNTPAEAARATLAGRAVVVDGDTIDLAGSRIRLLHIDAPESAQPGGSAATRHLAALIRGRSVTCAAEGSDAYGRVLAVCAAGGHDLGRAMVAAGQAAVFRRYGDAYDAEERAARSAQRGIWAEPDPLMPWDFRAASWQAADGAAPDPDCPIKGNVSATGVRIYHLPWSRSYGDTRIAPAKGERWFCSEPEAVAAGWRPARD